MVAFAQHSASLRCAQYEPWMMSDGRKASQRLAWQVAVPHEELVNEARGLAAFAHSKRKLGFI